MRPGTVAHNVIFVTRGLGRRLRASHDWPLHKNDSFVGARNTHPRFSTLQKSTTAPKTLYFQAGFGFQFPLIPVCSVRHLPLQVSSGSPMKILLLTDNATDLDVEGHPEQIDTLEEPGPRRDIAL